MASVQLSHGKTEYELSGSDQDPVVVLLHGGTVPMFTFDRQVPALVDAGFRTLRYDMYGRGRSACPAVVYDRELFRGQLRVLLGTLGLKQPVHLVGYSFGGAIAAHFTATHPEKVRSLALVAPVLRFEEGNAVVRTARTPLLGRPFVRFVAKGRLLERASRVWAGAEATEGYAQRFEEQLGKPGFDEAFLSFLRSDALGDYSETYAELGRQGRHALLVWGADDADIPAAHIERIRSLMPLAAYHELPGVHHGSVFRAAAQVNALLLDHLRKTAGP